MPPVAAATPLEATPPQPRPGAEPAPPPNPPKPPKPAGLREQVARTVGAARRLVTAHVSLAKAELAAIVTDVKQVAIEVGIAVALLIYVAMLVPVGSALFLGEWIFGSMGWGIVHGALFSVATAVVLLLGALRVSRSYLAGTLLAAVVVGVIVGTVLGLAWPNAVYASIGESLSLAVDPGVRPLVVGMIVGAVVLGLIGLGVGAWQGGGASAVTGLVAGAIAGFLVGAFTAISFSLQVGVALGITVALIVWPALAALALRGYDWEDLKRRFWPAASKAAAEETIEFVKARLPGSKEDAA